jgi:hypothetical protein
MMIGGTKYAKLTEKRTIGKSKKPNQNPKRKAVDFKIPSGVNEEKEVYNTR